MTKANSAAILTFPFDTGFYRNEKIMLLRGLQGAAGIEIYQRLICKIYEKNGYFLDFEKPRIINIFSQETDYSPEDIQLIIETCVRLSLFDQNLYERINILSSQGIQRRYFMAVKERGIKAFTRYGKYTFIYKDLCLLSDEELSGLNKSRVWLKVGQNYINPHTIRPSRNVSQCPGQSKTKIKSSISCQYKDRHDSKYYNNNIVKSSQSVKGKEEKMQNIEDCYNLIKENIDYSALIKASPNDVSLIDAIVDIMADALISQGETIRLGGENKPRELVAGVLLKLDYMDILFVIDKFKEISWPISKKNRYILTMLYNAVMEREAHYINLVQTHRNNSPNK